MGSCEGLVSNDSGESPPIALFFLFLLVLRSVRIPANISHWRRLLSFRCAAEHGCAQGCSAGYVGDSLRRCRLPEFSLGGPEPGRVRKNLWSIWSTQFPRLFSRCS